MVKIECGEDFIKVELNGTQNGIKTQINEAVRRVESFLNTMSQEENIRLNAIFTIDE
jgi:hypothetical protein